MIFQEALLSALESVEAYSKKLKKHGDTFAKTDPAVYTHYLGQVVGILDFIEDMTPLLDEDAISVEELTKALAEQERKHDQLIKKSRRLQKTDPAVSVAREGEAAGIVDAVRNVRLLLGLPPYGPLV